MRYFLSDLHLDHWDGYKGIITFERTCFPDIKTHNQTIIDMIVQLTNKLKPEDEVWNLGDFGSLDYLYLSDMIRDTGAKSIFLYGNHDKQENLSLFKQHFDEVYLYPVYLSQKLVVSHYPVAVWNDSVNVCGHLHGAKLQTSNHICASIHVANYQPISDNHINAIFSKLPKFTRRFLYEPWANDYRFIQPKEDVIMDPNGNIDLSASRLLQRINTEKRKLNNNSYQPYNGEGIFK